MPCFLVSDWGSHCIDGHRWPRATVHMLPSPVQRLQESAFSVVACSAVLRKGSCYRQGTVVRNVAAHMAGRACTNRTRPCPGDEVAASGLRLEAWLAWAQPTSPLRGETTCIPRDGAVEKLAVPMQASITLSCTGEGGRQWFTPKGPAPACGRCDVMMVARTRTMSGIGPADSFMVHAKHWSMVHGYGR